MIKENTRNGKRYLSYHGKESIPWGGEHTMGRRAYHGEESIPWGGEHTMGRRAYHGEESIPWGGEHFLSSGEKINMYHN